MQSIEGVIRRRDRPGYLRSKYGKGIRSPLPPYGVVSDKQNSPADFLQRTADGSRSTPSFPA